MPNIVYIMSLDHSGSTLLDISMGGVPGVFSMGELQFLNSQLMHRGSDNPQHYCSCGEQLSDCSIWAEVLTQFSTQYKVDLINDPSSLPLSLNLPLKRYSYRLHHRLGNVAVEKAVANGLPLLTRMMCGLYRTRANHLFALLDILQEHTDAKWLVDSSKNLARYLYLREMNPGKTFAVFLVRNIEGYATSSHTGLDPLSIERKIKHWTHFHAHRLPPILNRLQDSEYAFVNYEEFCQRPRAILTSLAQRLGIYELDGVDLENVYAYRSHTIQGNPIRLKKESVPIRYDARWKDRLKEPQLSMAKRGRARVAHVLNFMNDITSENES